MPGEAIFSFSYADAAAFFEPARAFCKK
jgi:hypothetical protein